MLSGKRFSLSRSITGILLENGATSVVTIPTGATIRVLSGPDANGKVQDKGIVYVVWEARTVAVFAIDLEARGIEVAGERGSQPERPSLIGGQALQRPWST